MNLIFFTHNLFGLKHIILIIVSIFIVVLGSIFSRKLTLNKMIKILFYVGLVSEVIKVIYYIITNEAEYDGYLPKTDLPFHLCSIQILFVTYLFISKNERVKRGIMSFMMPSCLLGFVFAILLSTYSSRNGLWIITLQYYLYHCAIGIFAIYLLINKEINWKVKDYLTSLMILGIFGFVSIYLNSILNDGTNTINFMYTIYPPAENLPYLNRNHGWFVYFMHYVLLAIILVTLIYIKPIINGIKYKINSIKDIS